MKLENMIKTIEQSKTVLEASKALGISQQAIYDRLKRNGLMIKKHPLEVIKRSNDG